MIPDRIEVNVAGGLDFPLPPMAQVRQKFDPKRLDDIAGAVRREFQRPEIRSQVKPGQVIAVGCGSRGVANIGLIARTVIQELQALGGKLPTNSANEPKIKIHGHDRDPK